jgi:oxygen-independent coproporphyrinogen-3 oxidase
MAADVEPGPIRHLYVHVPFCGRRCSYCDFSIAVRREVPAFEFSASVAAELTRRAADVSLADLDTVYFGGGTPSKLGPAGVKELLRRIADAGIRLATDAEVTLEANPEDVSSEAAAAWLEAGVNRLSLGVQSLAPEALSWMHRTHDAGQAMKAVQTVRSAGFANISIDLIYAIPDRIARSWGDDLSRAIELAPDHLSVYGLTVEPRTPLGKWTARGTEVQQSDDRAADEFLTANARLTKAGFEHYEVSSYARPSFRSRHNSAYWRRVPYLGLGPSAHSFDGRTRRWNIAAFAAWETALAAGADPAGGDELLTDEQHAAERLYLSLRTDAGAWLSGADLTRARQWVAAGWATEAKVEESPGAPSAAVHVRLTPEGWLRLDALVGALSA